MKKLFIFCMTLLGTTVAGVAGTSYLRVQPLEGQARTSALETIGKVVYRNDSMYIVDKTDFVVYQEALSKIQRLDFTDKEQETSTETATAELTAYPNPTQGTLMVQHATGKTVRVYDVQGKLVLTTDLEEGSSKVDVSGLPKGNYLLLVENGIFRFIKE